MSGGFFRGTSADQDTRFSNKMKKLLKSQKFAPELDVLVDMTKVKVDVIRPWIATRVTELLGFEDEVLINFIYGMLDGKEVDGKHVQIQLTGFMEKNTGRFMKELWILLTSAQKNLSGIPQEFLDVKAEEQRLKKAENDRIVFELQRKREQEKEAEQERLRELASSNSASEIIHGYRENDKRSYRARSRSPNRSWSRCLAVIIRGCRSPVRRRHHSRNRSQSPRRSGRSRSPDRHGRLPRAPHSPVRRHHSPNYSRSPVGRRRHHTPDYSRSPVGRRRSPKAHRLSPRFRPASRSPRPQRSPSSPQPRRSPSSPRPRRSPTPPRPRRFPSSPRPRRSPSSPRHHRSPSSARRRRSPSHSPSPPRQDFHSRGSHRRERSSSREQQTRQNGNTLSKERSPSRDHQAHQNGTNLHKEQDHQGLDRADQGGKAERNVPLSSSRPGVDVPLTMLPFANRRSASYLAGEKRPYSDLEEQVEPDKRRKERIVRRNRSPLQERNKSEHSSDIERVQSPVGMISYEDSIPKLETVSMKASLQENKDAFVARSHHAGSLSPKVSGKATDEKMRRKEEKRLRKEEHRRRREEKHKRRAEKHAAKAASAMVTDVDEVDRQLQSPNVFIPSDEEHTENEQKLLEDALRRKALESLRAKRAISQ
ncbi:unnamed protein product [Sphagnum troendelagicum]|uniref:PWI domain-containing protein n=1 Tax=Sphagnum troendelagicum TaxID=128251 RepID=A0ABP0UG14_9BRYO